MKKITLLIALMITSLGFAQQNFPFNFESATVFNDFDLAVTTRVANPSATGINTSANVMKIVRGAASFSGTKITVAAPIDFTTNKVIKMKVWFPVAGQRMIMKFEDLGTIAGDFEQSVANIPAMVWTEISFDYQVGSNNTRDQLVFLLNPGVNGDGGVNSTYYIDDITFSPPTVVSVPITSLNVNFESPTIFAGFDAGVYTDLVSNDLTTGINSSATAGRVSNINAQLFTNFQYRTPTGIDLSTGNMGFSMMVKGPRAIPVKFKVEGGTSFEVDANYTTPGVWQKLTFDFSTQTSKNNNFFLFFLDITGTPSVNPANDVFLIDNVVFGTLASLSTTKFDKSTVKMYPNPVRNTLTIEANSEIQRVSVYNVLGQEVLSRSPKSNASTLQTNDLQKGVYMVTTEIDGNISSSKIVKE